MSAYGSFEYSSVSEWLNGNGIFFIPSSGGHECRIVCPLCGHTKQKSDKSNTTLTIHNESGAWICHRCNNKGNWKILGEYLNKSGDTVELREARPEDHETIFPVPEEIAFQVEESHVRLMTGGEKEAQIRNWFLEKKGITQDTLRRFKVGYSGYSITFPIYSVEGTLLTVRYRRDPADNRAGSKFWSLADKKTHLFNAGILLDNPELIYLANEGEFKSMILSQKGLPSLSHTGGANGFQPEWIDVLKTYGVKTVIVIGDVDHAGKEGARKTALLLHKQGLEARILSFPDTFAMSKPDGDINDFFMREGIAQEKKEREFATLVTKAEVFSTEKEESFVFTVFNEMKALGYKSIKVKYRIPDVFLTIPDDPVHAYPIDGLEVNDYIVAFYWSKYNEYPNDSMRDKIKGLFRAECTDYALKNEREEMYTRYYQEGKRSDIKLIINVSDSKNVISIDKNGFTVTQSSPVRFFRNPFDKPLYLPDQTAQIEDFRQLLSFTRLATIEDELLFLSYLVAAVFPRHKRLANVFTGPAGSGKSTHMSLQRTIIDPFINGDFEPVDGGFYAPQNDLGKITNSEVKQQAQWSYCLSFDNLRGVEPGVSAYLCTLVTGGVSMARTLFTDNTPYPFIAHPLLSFNGIDLVMTEPDLLSRSVLFETQTKKIMENESEYWRRFNELRPKIMGGFYKLISTVIANYDTVIPIKNTFRLAESGHIMYCAALALGYSEAEFRAAVEQNNRRKDEGATGSSVVAENFIAWLQINLRDFLKNVYEPMYLRHERVENYNPNFINYLKETNTIQIEVTQTALFTSLVDVAKDITGNQQSFPRDAVWLIRKLNAVTESLQSQYGLTIDTRGRRAERRFTTVTLSLDKAKDLASL